MIMVQKTKKINYKGEKIMDEYNISGYGVDLGELYDIADLTTEEDQLYTDLMSCDSFLDAIDVISNGDRGDQIMIDTPCNTDDFECFMNFPDQPQVIEDGDFRHLFTKSVANKMLQNHIDAFLRQLYDYGEYEQPASVLDTLIPKLQALVPEYASHQDFQDYC